MKKLIFIVLVLAAAFAVYWFKFKGDDAPAGPKQQPLVVGIHSAAFNSSIDSMIQYYFQVRDAFSEGDSLKAKNGGMELVAYTNRMNLDELKKDTTGIFETAASFINDLRASAEGMGQAQTISDMRMDFKSINDNLYPFLKAIRYEGGKLFWQYCPTAFGENRGANWLSTTTDVVNPYTGKGGAACGEVQDTIKAQ